MLSPSPDSAKAVARQSLGRATPTLVPASPRPASHSNTRPTSELPLGSAGIFQTPEAEALDQWFENLQNYEATLEEMAAASLDVDFKEELGAIEQWFKVLSEAERTAALYSLLQHSTQVQIRFFITVLQQMARSDPMTALLSPAMGSMQNQMEASLARIKSPGLKSNMPASPTTRNFNPNRQSLIFDNFLSPDSAATNAASDAAATLAQQRARLKNAEHRISAPVLASAAANGRASWAPTSSLPQVSEASAPAQEILIGASRPKSGDFSGTSPSPRLSGGSPNEGQSWASMVNTPAIPLFPKNTRAADSANTQLNEWNQTSGPGVPRMGDPTVYRKKPVSGDKQNENGNHQHYDDNGNLVNQDARGRRNASGGWGGRSQAPPTMNSNPANNRFNNNGDEANGMNGLGMQLGGLHLGMGSPQMHGMPPAAAAAALANMAGPMSPFNMNMLSAIALSPEAQLLAAQVAAANAQGYGHPGWLGMPSMSAGVNPHGGGSAVGGNNNRRGGGNPPSGRSTTGFRSAAPSVGSNAIANINNNNNNTPKGEEEVDPALLNDIPAWLRSLRLHKYTPNFEGMRWQDIVVMDEGELEGKGVAALGARRKMLKTFEVVRRKMGMEGVSGETGNANGV
ncbi:hypothetical protein AGABI1DRAFT_113773 [Agaricus bisporus var. burnettii JB137-S8]|uniref:RNA-binding protein VTS1 n=2 Tax=Agaricus bisporus var. burnettii TaxID=192524 RepID=K5X874_AGABU|nr:uncharacterized protein AGABI1DRAFT_113773 [Agaricus bisporus var. burnettii JB137-S8]EKM79172.1 hypothetical protein AGABI1DRAFT_113773 [Agaricus bisporus var. burnettii JB137-S8]KAF7767971.1 hypothetical protein Agabi119p4_7214 [Agaricus bisporus var. burnettii]